MSEELEKQEGQKTVVAFISGLLIGGLLVWVFSSSPEQVEAPEVMDDTETEQSDSDTGADMSGEAGSDVRGDTTSNTPATTVPVGDGSITINNQPAGTAVAITDLELPTEAGWIGVREVLDGMPGNILGAARYSVEEGLVPTEIELIRGTVSGGNYEVIFFTNYGDKGFDLSEDTVIEGVSTTFIAQ